MTDPELRKAVNRGIACQAAGRTDDAARIYREVLKTNPAQPDALHWLGVIEFKNGDREKGLSHIRSSVEHSPTRADFLQNLGAFLRQAGMDTEAVSALRKAVALNPDSAEALTGLGAALAATGETQEALVRCLRAAELRPDLAEAWINLGFVMRLRGDAQASCACYERAVALNPALATAHQNLALSLFLLGRFEAAWREYEWRPAALHLCASAPEAKRWNGEPLSDETLLVHAEQGFGDTIQFFRYLPRLRRSAETARILFECPRPLTALLKSNAPEGIEILETTFRKGSPRIDRHIPLLSLPLALREYEPEETDGPYLRACDERRSAWRTRLGLSKKFRVGLCRAGNPRNPNDRLRSIPAEALLPLFDIPGVVVFNLHFSPEGPPENLGRAGMIDPTGDIADFADTAALLKELDLVVTADTAVAHLAGALGVPTLLLLPTVPDWRWGLDSPRTDWYPDIRIFRQKASGEWTPVVTAVAAEIRSKIRPD